MATSAQPTPQVDSFVIPLPRETLAVRAKRSARNAFLNFFRMCDRMAFHVIPRHYYSPVSDLAWLEKHKDLWIGRQRLHGIHWNLDGQLEWLKRISLPWYREVRGLALYRRVASQGWGPGYGAIESQVLHCFLRSERPRRIIEIGSGVSTACMCEANRMNMADGSPPAQITCIEPFPRPAFAGLTGVKHLPRVCQEVPPAVFDELGPGDLLFIDSSHAVKTGSDVIRIYLDVIPSLAAGVYIHIHDVYLPFAYPRDALTHFFGWQETALLIALLTGNPHIEVLASESALHYDRTAEMRDILTDYDPQANQFGLEPATQPLRGHFPSSLWLRKK
jgi:hypothetical protein